MATSVSLAISNVCTNGRTWALMFHQLVLSSTGCVDRVGGCINFHDIAQHVLVNDMINSILDIY